MNKDGISRLKEGVEPPTLIQSDREFWSGFQSKIFFWWNRISFCGCDDHTSSDLLKAVKKCDFNGQKRFPCEMVHGAPAHQLLFTDVRDTTEQDCGPKVGVLQSVRDLSGCQRLFHINHPNATKPIQTPLMRC